MASYLMWILTILAISISALSYLLHVPHSHQEPPFVPAKIPVIGHMLGLARHGNKYMAILADQVHHPIFTIKILRQKIYIISNARLVNAVQRSHRTLSFHQFFLWASERICGTSKAGLELCSEGFVEKMNRAIYPLLAPSAGLDSMYNVVIPIVGKKVDEMVGDGKRKVQLFEWLQEALTLASGVGMHGSSGPLNGPGAALFWQNEANLVSIIYGPAPKLFARHALATREALAQIFISYFRRGDYTQGSEVTRKRTDHLREAGMSIEDIGRTEVARTSGLLANTVPASFWMLYNIYSRPELLLRLRDEINATLTVMRGTSSERETRTLDVTQLQKRCPLLLSTFQETLRLRSEGTNVRGVTEDMSLDGRYLLVKGALVQIPVPSIHREVSSWGNDANEFLPERFLEKSSRRPTSSVAFRAFGGGTHTCPGRFFATTEILGLVAAVVLRCEIEPVEKNGLWPSLPTDTRRITSFVRPPKGDIEVVVKPVEGTSNDKCEWIFSLSASQQTTVDPISNVDQKEASIDTVEVF